MPEGKPVGEPQRELVQAGQEATESSLGQRRAAEQRDTARRLFDEGTRLLKESLFQQAVDKFKAALTHWDHPAIHYNMALALLNLNDPLSLHEHLRQALRYGPKPFEEDKFNVAKGSSRLVENQLATVDLSCNEPGAVVTFGGREMFTAPGHQTFLVVPGAHIAAASKAGARPTEWTRILVAGETTTFDLKVDMNATRDNVIAAVALAIAAGGIATGLVLDRLANDSEASAMPRSRVSGRRVQQDPDCVARRGAAHEWRTLRPASVWLEVSPISCIDSSRATSSRPQSAASLRC